MHNCYNLLAVQLKTSHNSVPMATTKPAITRRSEQEINFGTRNDHLRIILRVLLLYSLQFCSSFPTILFQSTYDSLLTHPGPLLFNENTSWCKSTLSMEISRVSLRIHFSLKNQCIEKKKVFCRTHLY